MEAARETKHSGDESAGSSDKNTIDSQREQTENREELLHHSQSQPSAPAQELTDRDEQNGRGQRKAGTAEKTLPFRDAPSGNETSAMEFLHLLDPKNYKFLPP